MDEDGGEAKRREGRGEDAGGGTGNELNKTGSQATIIKLQLNNVNNKKQKLNMTV